MACSLSLARSKIPCYWVRQLSIAYKHTISTAKLSLLVHRNKHHFHNHILSNLNKESVSWYRTSLYSSQETLRDNESSISSDTASTVVRDIYESIVFIDDNLVAVNKPRGVSVYGKTTSGGTVIQCADDNIDCIAQALPYLQEKLDCCHLEIGFSLKSYHSGLVLLCKSKESKAKLRKFVAGAESQKQLFMSYLAITFGVPQCPHNTELVASIERQWLHDREMSIVKDKGSNNARKAGNMIQTHFSVKPLLFNEKTGATLVEITLNKDKWDAVEVLMSHYLSPVLGDHIYSSRTITVMGVPFPASSHAAVPKKQRLPPEFEKALSSRIKPENTSLPLFLHRHKLTLSKFPTKVSPSLLLTAKPHKEFVSVLQCLGLYDQSLFS